MAGKLHDLINVYDSTWTLEEGNSITLSLEKSVESWWPRVLDGDEEIDLTKIESKKRMEEFDDETQSAIRKIMFDENQRRKGELTSDEQQLAAKLEAAWNAESSPFKGTTFDPNLVRNIQSQ
jgi:hypothetical protein